MGQLSLEKNTRLKQSIDLELEVMGNIMVLQQLIVRK